MKKKLITIALVLVLAITMATPALASTDIAQIDAALNRLIAEQGRVGIAEPLAAAREWMNDHPERIAGQGSTIAGHINNALNRAGPRPVSEITDPADWQFIHAQLSAAMSAAQLNYTFNMASLLDAVAGGTVTPAFIKGLVRITCPDGNVLWPVPGAPQPAATTDNVVRQTGFTADYSALVFVVLALTMLTGAALVTSVKLRRSVED